MTGSPKTRALAIAGTRLLLDGEPFYFQGLSFFNALYNPAFSRSAGERLEWLRTFKANGVNALRVWGQWDFGGRFRGLADVAPGHTLYTPAGDVRAEHFQTLVRLITAADSLGMVVEVTLFSHEKQPNLPVPALARAARGLAGRLRPYRNLILQIWNEDSTEVFRFFEAIKGADPERIVTNSPGVANVLGDEAQNRLLDLLTPHTTRHGADFWQAAPRQVAALLETYQKPVIDDEPARAGVVQFGGIEGGTRPAQHIEQIRQVRAAGGYHTYHHDMFQTGYGHPAVPPAGLPDPDFSPFHRQVFDFLQEHSTW